MRATYCERCLKTHRLGDCEFPETCEQCGASLALHLYDLCEDCTKLTDPGQMAKEQVAEAVRVLQLPESAYLRWPWRALDAIYGGLARGTVHFLCAFSGGGKTTVISSVTNRWLDQGVKVYALPLETTPNTFRTYLACERLGIPAGVVMSGDIHHDPSGEAKLAAIRGEIMGQPERYQGRLVVSPAAEINLKRFEVACEHAASLGADVVIVDHIDHIAAGDGKDLYAESVKVVKASLKMAQRLNLRLLLTSQLNLQITHGDGLAKYQPPQPQQLYMGGHKIHVATGIIGLYRPIRDRLPTELPATHKPESDPYIKLLQRARRREVEPSEVLEPNTVGVVLMKSRNHGAREGSRVKLEYRNGRVLDRLVLAGRAA